MSRKNSSILILFILFKCCKKKFIFVECHHEKKMKSSKHIEFRILGRRWIVEQRQSCGQLVRCSKAERRALALGNSCKCIRVVGQSLPVGHECTRWAGNSLSRGEVLPNRSSWRWQRRQWSRKQIPKNISIKILVNF